MIILMLGVLGLCFGSLINALVWRIHEQARPVKKQVAPAAELSILKGRSMCPYCQHTLAWYDLLPIVSWLWLKGKCRYCNQGISAQYPLIEMLTATLFVYSYWYWPYTFNEQGITLFVFWLLFLVGMVALLVYDMRWMLLPNRIIFPLQALAALYVLVKALMSNDGLAVIFGAILGALCIAGLFYGLFQVSKGRWIGGGDVKLAVILGLLAGGPFKAVLIIFIASLLGSVVGVPLLLLSKVKAKTRIPFGPFLIMATIIVYLFGTGLIAWYKRQFLLV